MPYPWQPGMRITAARLNEGAIQVIEQTSDQTVTNSTTYVNSQIVFTPVAGARYVYNLLISYSGGEGDLKWRWDAPGATLASFTSSRHIDATGTFNAPASVIFRRPGNTTDRLAGAATGQTALDSFYSAYDQGTLIADTAQPIVMQFSQNTASTVATILRGSTTQTRLIVQRYA